MYNVTITKKINILSNNHISIYEKNVRLLLFRLRQSEKLQICIFSASSLTERKCEGRPRD